MSRSSSSAETDMRELGKQVMFLIHILNNLEENAL